MASIAQRSQLRKELVQAFKEEASELGLEGEALANYVKENVDKELNHLDEEAERKRKIEKEKEEIQHRRDMEARQQEEDNKYRMAQLEKGMGISESRDTSSTPADQNHLASPAISFHLDPFNDRTESIDVYLDRFERLSAEYQLPEDRMSLKLSQSLRGVAYDTYLKLPLQKKDDYTALKQALLTRYELSAESYRRKFRQTRREKNETYANFTDRLDSYLTKWLVLSPFEEDYDGLRSLLMCEQLREAMTPEVRTFISEQGGESLNDLITLADRYIVAHETENKPRRQQEQGSLQHQHRGWDSSKHSQQKGNQKSQTPNTQGITPKSGHKQEAWHKPQLFCKFCKIPGHVMSECRKLKRVKAEQDTVATVSGPSLSHGALSRPQVIDTVMVNGHPVTCLYDTGLSFSAIVKRSCIDPTKLTSDSVTLQGVDRTLPPTTLPICTIEVDSKYVTGTVRAAVMDNPIHDLVLGCQYVYLGTPPTTPLSVAAVETRAQKACSPSPPLAHNTLPDEMKIAQKEDNTLQPCFKKATPGNTHRKKGDFFLKNGLLHREGKDNRSQLVVPTTFRTQILELGHDIPFSGHMGIGATIQRITAHYYWPGVNTDVTNYVKSCHTCQVKTTRKTTVPVTLGEMPIVGTPFQRVAVDIVGPLPLTKKKNRFILTLVDSCSMWSEAVPLPHIDAKRVAEALISMFTRLGFPEQILSDNGSQFTGTLLQEVFHLFSTQHFRSARYHPMSNGQVEKWNGTLTTILKKLVSEKANDWDTYIPAALFAYRDVPHASTGQTPAMTLFGRPLAGPLEALRHTWTDQQVDDTVRDASQYVAELREKLRTTWNIATQQLKRARARQARYYNKHAKDRELQVGDKVLLLLTSGGNKLQLKWEGPYEVKSKMSRTNYKVEVKGKIKVYHINLLKRYEERQQEPTFTQLALALAEESEATAHLAAEVPLKAKETHRDVLLSPTLSPQEKKEASHILERHSDVLTDLPGRTDLEEFSMKLLDSTPVYVRPYTVPLAKQDSIREEIDALLRAGIISPSSSPYSAGVVLLRKPSGEHRLCIDFRKLNAVTQFQPEPLPDPLDTFAKLKDAKFFSRIDLSKGYYQIPVAQDSRQYLAFSTQEGHYEFNVLPFGLHLAPSVFSRMMRKLLTPLRSPFVHHFMDDILLATPTWKEHIELLEKLLARLRATGLTARPSKCNVGYKELPYLGHLLKQGCIQPEEKNISKLKNAPQPDTKKGVRSFLGLCGFYQRYIKDFNKIAAPLSDLTRKTAPEKVRWTKECEQAFTTLKECLVSNPILHLPDPSKPYILRTDASGYGIGAMLAQRGEEDPKMLYPIAYASRKLSSAEQKYATIEKECLALIWGIQKFQMYLYGAEFVIQTDHQPLSFLASSTKLNARLMRWSLLLQSYSFRVEYIRGTDNHGADFLSRHLSEEVENSPEENPTSDKSLQ